MSDLLREAKEALDTARKAVEAVSQLGIASPLVKTALVTLLNLNAQLAAILGVPGAIEPEPGAQPRVTTSEDFRKA